MITNILKLSEIKKDPALLIGLARPAIITKYGSPLAYVLPPEKMDNFLKIEKILNDAKEAVRLCTLNLHTALNEAEDGNKNSTFDHIASAMDDIYCLFDEVEDE